jgi:hypothetical protein
LQQLVGQHKRAITAVLACVYFFPDSQFMEEERPDTGQQQNKGDIGSSGKTLNIHGSIPSIIRIKVPPEFCTRLFPLLATSS